MGNMKRVMWIIMYSTRKKEFITFDLNKLEMHVSMELVVCGLIHVTVEKFRKVMISEYNGQIGIKRSAKQRKFYDEPEPVWNYTELYFKTQQDAERALGWVNGQLLLYILEHPGYNLKNI